MKSHIWIDPSQLSWPANTPTDMKQCVLYSHRLKSALIHSWSVTVLTQISRLQFAVMAFMLRAWVLKKSNYSRDHNFYVHQSCPSQGVGLIPFTGESKTFFFCFFSQVNRLQYITNNKIKTSWHALNNSKMINKCYFVYCASKNLFTELVIINEILFYSKLYKWHFTKINLVQQITVTVMWSSMDWPQERWIGNMNSGQYLLKLGAQSRIRLWSVKRQTLQERWNEILDTDQSAYLIFTKKNIFNIFTNADSHS